MLKDITISLSTYMLLKTQGKFGNIKHARSDFSSEPLATTKKDQIQDKKIKVLASKVKSLEHKPMLKYLDTYYTSALLAAGSIVCINPLAQGDDFNQRGGEQVYSKFLSCRFRLNRPSASTADFIRIMVFWDKQFNGTGGSIGGLVDGVLDNDVITGIALSPYNHRCAERYKILYDKTFTFNPNSTATDEGLIAKVNINLHGVKVNYSDSGATFASITDRGLLFFVSSSNTAITPAFAFRYWYTNE